VERQNRVPDVNRDLIREDAKGAGGRRAITSPGLKRIAIVGLPNSGKSQLFNSLTGAYGLVSNYPLTTVEVTKQRCFVGGECWEVADTPGLHGLYIQSEEELVVRTLLFTEAPDLLVQCVDANRLKESLLLTADLLNLGIPLILVLIAVGESRHRGLRLDAEKLSLLLGIPLVQSPAPGKGIAELRHVLRAPVPAPPPMKYSGALGAAIDRVAEILPHQCPYPRESAVLLLQDDPSFIDMLATSCGSAVRDDGELERIRSDFAGKAAMTLRAHTNRWVDGIAAAVATSVAAPRSDFSETFARLCRHPLYGLPILALFLGVVYFLVVGVAGGLSLFLTTTISDPVVQAVGSLLPPGFWKDLLIGSHGLLTLGLFNSLTTVLPILSVFFLLFGLLEDIGYLPNLAILTRRISEKIGITGNAVIPLVLGFGCKTMATMTARTLQSRKEKIIAIALIAFAIPCSAQMGLSIAILGQHGLPYFITAFAFLVLAEVAVGLVLNRVLPDDTRSQFIQELPRIRAPRIAAVARKTGYRLLWFLREAIPIFLAASLAMFVIDKLGLLALLKQALKPVITGALGLPLDMVDALLLTLARSEAAAGLVLRMSREGTLSGVQSIVAVVLLVTFAQCFANIAAIFKELGARVALLIVAAIYLMSFALTGAVHAFLVVAGGALRL
jgi:ferrous iron transport protein B